MYGNLFTESIKFGTLSHSYNVFFCMLAVSYMNIHVSRELCKINDAFELYTRFFMMGGGQFAIFEIDFAPPEMVLNSFMINKQKWVF